MRHRLTAAAAMHKVKLQPAGGSSVRIQTSLLFVVLPHGQATSNLSEVLLTTVPVGLVVNDLLQCDAPLRLATEDLFSLVGDPTSLGGDNLLL
jgi:hypothetical protein